MLPKISLMYFNIQGTAYYLTFICLLNFIHTNVNLNTIPNIETFQIKVKNRKTLEQKIALKNDKIEQLNEIWDNFPYEIYNEA